MSLGNLTPPTSTVRQQNNHYSCRESNIEQHNGLRPMPNRSSYRPKGRSQYGDTVRDKNMRIQEPAREVQVVHETEVLVVGSGPGGLAAALGARPRVPRRVGRRDGRVHVPATTRKYIHA